MLESNCIKLCECGCGSPSPIARKSNKKAGHVKGQPVRFIVGHYARTRQFLDKMAVVNAKRARHLREFMECTVCKQLLPLVMFGKNSGMKYGIQYECKLCNRRRTRAYMSRPENREKARLRNEKNYNPAKRREQYLANKENFDKRSRKSRQKLKDEVFAAYGGYLCRCCGELEKSFLVLDHIHNDGAAHRKAIRKVGSSMYYWLKNNGFPPIVQVLCQNCNWGKRVNGGVCPHKEKEGASLLAS